MQAIRQKSFLKYFLQKTCFSYIPYIPLIHQTQIVMHYSQK